MVSFYFLVRYNRPFSAGILWNAASSLRHRRNLLTPASNVCEAAPRPLLRVPNRFSGIRDFPYLKFGIRDLKAKSGRDSVLKVCAGSGISNITLGITGLQGISGRDYGIKEPYWGPSLFWTHYGLNELPEARFEFLSTWLANRERLFLTRQSWCVFKSGYTGEGPRTRISALFRRRTWPKFTFVRGAGYAISRTRISRFTGTQCYCAG